MRYKTMPSVEQLCADFSVGALTVVAHQPEGWRNGKGKEFVIYKTDTDQIVTMRNDRTSVLAWMPDCTLDHFLNVNPNLRKFLVN